MFGTGSGIGGAVLFWNSFQTGKFPLRLIRSISERDVHYA
jgi:hypothetical protein